MAYWEVLGERIDSHAHWGTGLSRGLEMSCGFFPKVGVLFSFVAVNVHFASNTDTQSSITPYMLASQVCPVSEKPPEL